MSGGGVGTGERAAGFRSPHLLRMHRSNMDQKCLPSWRNPARHPTSPHGVALWLRATVEMRLRRVYAQGGVHGKCAGAVVLGYGRAHCSIRRSNVRHRRNTGGPMQQGVRHANPARGKQKFDKDQLYWEGRVRGVYRNDQVIRENPASRGTETSAEVLVGPPWRMVSNAGQQQWY